MGNNLVLQAQARTSHFGFCPTTTEPLTKSTTRAPGGPLPAWPSPPIRDGRVREIGAEYSQFGATRINTKLIFDTPLTCTDCAVALQLQRCAVL